MSACHIPTCVVDFESRSACNLKKSGAWKYSLDSTTEVMCLVYRLPYWPEGKTALWHPAYPSLGLDERIDADSLTELCEWIATGQLLEAHNAFFERSIWANILAPRHGFPRVGENQWRCSAAKAASHALPRHLGDAGAALHLAIQKDDDGKKVMMKVSKPRKPRKKERETWAKAHGDAPMPLLWWESLELFERLWAYCESDVLAEEALSHALDDLSPQETDYYCLDQRMNERGFQLDMEAVSTALTLIAAESHLLNQELADLTEGKVPRATQRAQLKAWLETQGVVLDNTKRGTIDQMLKEDEDNQSAGDELPPWVELIPPTAKRALEILRTLGRSSTAKYETMRGWAAPDGRVRGGLLFHGASTGRWSGAGVQPHNFPRGTIKGFDMEDAWRLFKKSDRSLILNRYPSVMEALACGLRGAIIAGPGKQLYCADYASIEARVLLWLAGEEGALDLFRSGGDLYCDMASDIYNRPITKDDKFERGVGKIAILGLGYQMGWSKFQETAAAGGMVLDDDFAQNVVNAYRDKYAGVKSLWYETEEAACDAVDNHGEFVEQDRLSWQQIGDFLYCTLPSGRRLAYAEPEIRERETPWGAKKSALTFMGVNPHNRQWQRQTTYGGSLVENIVQAVSRDIMAHALYACDCEGVYVPVLSVHDEVIAEAEVGQGTVHEFEQRLTTLPPWADGCPIAAEGWAGTRYRK